MADRQFAALPFRMRNAELDVLLITTRRKRRWSVPKGWPIAGKPQRTVANEAYEEAGLTGNVSSRPIGRYKHRKRKGRRKIACQVNVFPLRVRGQEKRWPERGQREAIWLPAHKAAKLVHKPQLARLIQRFARRKRKKIRRQQRR
jgi:8-oxo-dGTP pyrophosphatase MutT (NUDIX family)